MIQTDNYYKLLDVDPNDSPSEIRKAYFKKIRQYSNETHPEQFKLLTKAYKTLSNQEKKYEYDLELQGGGTYRQSIDEIRRLYQEGYAQQALQLAEERLVQFPGDRDILHYKSMSLMDLEQYDQAERILLRINMNVPNDLDTLLLLGRLYQEKGQWHRAKEPYQKLISLQPEESNHYLRLSNIHFQLNEYEAAMSILEQRLQMRQETVHDFPLLSELYFLTMGTGNHDAYHQEVVERIIHLGKTDDEKATLVNMLINLCSDIGSEHYAYKELLQMITRINYIENGNVRDWIDDAYGAIDPNRHYYGDPEHNSNQFQTTHTPPSSSTSKTDMRGSIVAAVIFGLIAAYLYGEMTGIIVGIVWYLFGNKIKEWTRFVGCLIIIVVLSFIITNL